MSGKVVGETRAGTRMIRSVVRPLTDAIAAAQAEAHDGLANLGRGKAPEWWWLITMAPALDVAVVTTKSIFGAPVGQFTIQRPLTALAATIGDNFKLHVEFLDWRDEEAEASKADPEHHNTFLEYLRVTSNLSRKSYRRFLSRVERRRDGPWSHNTRISLGVKMLTCLTEACPKWFSIRRVRNRRGTVEYAFVLSEECWSTLATWTEASEVNEPFLTPMIVEPVPWEVERERYVGGYLLHSTPLVRRSHNKHTAALSCPVSIRTMDAVNAIQRTPWRVNDWTYGVMAEAFESGMSVGELPFGDPSPLPRVDDEEWSRMSEDEKSQWRGIRADIHAKNASLVGRRKAFLGQTRIAKMCRGKTIWFPHNLDFRTRIYPIPQDLHPQGNDIAKSLLTFGRGKALGSDGLFWLGVRLANTFGQDKLPIVDRHKWAVDNAEMIFDCADDPLDGSRAWTEADEPWGFLATCREWTNAMSLDNPEGYVSTLPVNMDGSCNGLQHLATMARDPHGAKMTNVAANEERHDIYVTVAETVKRMVSEDAAAGVVEAHWWIGKIDRKVVKRAVMTTPYGVTSRGVSTQLMSDGHCDGMEDRASAAVYLRKKITAALDENLTAAKAVMSWLQAVARTLAQHGVVYEFTTPTGNRVRQAYFDLIERQVQTLVGSLVLWREDEDMPLRVKKQSQSAPPNTIHAFDAAHCQMTVNRMVDEIDDPCFAMIHDSFGTHAADVETMNRLTRETFIEIYRDNWLDRLLDGFRAIDPAVRIPHWSEFVTMGDFDVREVAKSEFFFA